MVGGYNLLLVKVLIHSWSFSCIIFGSFDWKGPALHDLWTQGAECIRPSTLQLLSYAINSRLFQFYVVHFQISTLIMSLELFLMIFFGTLTCVLGILQLWMAFHQYIFWVRQLWNRRVVTLQNYDNNLLEAMDQQLSASIESFATCDTSFA